MWQSARSETRQLWVWPEIRAVPRTMEPIRESVWMSRLYHQHRSPRHRTAYHHCYPSAPAKHVTTVIIVASLNYFTQLHSGNTSQQLPAQSAAATDIHLETDRSSASAPDVAQNAASVEVVTGNFGLHSASAVYECLTVACIWPNVYQDTFVKMAGLSHSKYS